MVTDNRKCYFPSGADAPNNVPCRSETNTWCCGAADICLDNGLCLNAGHQPYMLSRGACTSKAWAGCTDHCTKSNPKAGASITNVFFNGTVSRYCCGTPIAIDSTVICPSDSDDGGKPFEVRTGKPITGRALLADVQSVTNTSSSTGNDTSAGTIDGTNTCKSCHDTAIGAGVGVPLGALALLFLIWAIVERRRTAQLRRALSNPVLTTTMPTVPIEAGNSEASEHSRKRNQMIELEGARPELDGGYAARG